jgi:hypothetical protein
MSLPQSVNELGLEGARALAGALEKMTGIQRLKLVRVAGGWGRAKARSGAVGLLELLP